MNVEAIIFTLPSSLPHTQCLDQANGGALLENVRERGDQLRAGLEALRVKYPDTIAGKWMLRLFTRALSWRGVGANV